jgi:hypothetical protein
MVLRLLEGGNKLALIAEAFGCIFEWHTGRQHGLEARPQVRIQSVDKRVTVPPATPPATSSAAVLIVVIAGITTARIAATAALVVLGRIPLVSAAAAIAPTVTPRVTAAFATVAATVAPSVAAPLSDVAPTVAACVAAADVLRRPTIPASSAPIAPAAYAAGIPAAAAAVAGVCARAATAPGVTWIDARVATTAAAATTAADVRPAASAAPGDLGTTPSGRPLPTSLRRYQRTQGKAPGGDEHHDWRRFHGLSSYACVYDDCRGRTSLSPRRETKLTLRTPLHCGNESVGTSPVGNPHARDAVVHTGLSDRGCRKHHDAHSSYLDPPRREPGSIDYNDLARGPSLDFSDVTHHRNLEPFATKHAGQLISTPGIQVE